MNAALAIAVGLLLCACVYYVRMGCRAIGELCAELERDRQVEYSHPVPAVPRRSAPGWIQRLRSESSLAFAFRKGWRGALRAGRAAVGRPVA